MRIYGKSGSEARLASTKCTLSSLHAYLRCFGPFCSFRAATQDLLRIYGASDAWGRIHAFFSCDLACRISCVFHAFWQTDAFSEGRSLEFSALFAVLSVLKATFDAYLRDFQQFIAFWGHGKNRLWIDKIMILPAFFHVFSRFARFREFLERRFDAYYAGSVRDWVIWKDTGRQF